MPSCRGRAGDACPGGAPAALGAVFAFRRESFVASSVGRPGVAWARAATAQRGAMPSAEIPARSRGPTASTATDTTEMPATITNSLARVVRGRAPGFSSGSLFSATVSLSRSFWISASGPVGARGTAASLNATSRRMSVQVPGVQEGEGAAEILDRRIFWRRPCILIGQLPQLCRSVYALERGGQQSGEARHRVFTCLGRVPERQTPGDVKVQVSRGRHRCGGAQLGRDFLDEGNGLVP